MTTNTATRPTRQTSAKATGSKVPSTDSAATDSAATPIPELTIEEIQSELTKVNLELAELPNNPQSARAAAYATSLMLRLTEIDARSRVADAALREAALRDLDALRPKVDSLIADHSRRMIALELASDAHGAKLIEHGKLFAQHDTKHAHSEKRLTNIEDEIYIPPKVFVITTVIAVFVGIIASLLWSAIVSTPAPVTLADGTIITQYNPLDELWAAILAGFMAAFVVCAIVPSMILRNLKRNKNNDVATNEDVEKLFNTDQPNTDTTPTKPSKATAGAFGARD